jgi:sugar lactone lactonase YvrE
MFQRLRVPVACAAVLGTVLALSPASMASGATGAPSSVQARSLFPTEFPLPTGFLPEGIAIGVLPIAYFGSRADGDIYRVNLITGEGRVFSQGPGTPSVGMKIDLLGRLFVAGGPGGDGRVVNAWTGEIIASYPFVTPATGTFVNDVIVTPRGAYFTDSQRPVLYHVPFGRFGRLPDASGVETIPLSGDFQQQPGFNTNGIARTPDGKALIIVQSNTGFLFRVDPATGVTTRIDIGAATVPMGDGLLVVGHTLFVVRNSAEIVVVIRLNDEGTSGTVTDELTDPRFDVPTTVAAYGNRLYLPNARFGVENPEQATYNAVAIPRP